LFHDYQRFKTGGPRTKQVTPLVEFVLAAVVAKKFINQIPRI
jgi:hypothetical protein